MAERTPTELRGVLDNAIRYVDTYVPVMDRTPTPGGGEVRVAAVAILVAVRAVIEAMIEHDAKEPSHGK